ncbi:hypothetical protein [Specibacter cremeus]|uniref:hypothetical protein n=1 Tax=Specibacter cremeus TaxID=1629051 RepID=UPI000F7A898A|nr:hypothetical protein [Specibacter cremeus]
MTATQDTPDPSGTTVDALHLNGRTFDLQSSSASVVATGHATRFHYFEEGGVLWGDYAGDTVKLGRFAGKRVGSRIELAFVHSTTSDAVVFGSATSEISRERDGKLKLTEFFKGPDGTDQTSICLEA